jgi:hypothetical protein
MWRKAISTAFAPSCPITEVAPLSGVTTGMTIGAASAAHAGAQKVSATAAIQLDGRAKPKRFIADSPGNRRNGRAAAAQV